MVDTPHEPGIEQGQGGDAGYPWTGREHWTREDWDRWQDATLARNRYLGPDFDKIVGQNLQGFRTAAGLTQADLAAALSAGGDTVHQQTIQKIEKGSRPLKYNEAMRICKTLEISPWQLGDRAELAASNAHFLEKIVTAQAIEAELKSAATRLSTCLVGLAEMLGLRQIGSAGCQPDEYLAERAKGLIARNWGKRFNEALGLAIREHEYVDDKGLSASTYAEILQTIVDGISPINSDDEDEYETWADDSDA